MFNTLRPAGAKGHVMVRTEWRERPGSDRSLLVSVAGKGSRSSPTPSMHHCAEAEPETDALTYGELLP